ncbi:MAG TPA: inorganic diphosphatase [Limnochordia bacterium]|nr:inorganic diphosphatase [Limnochordia bacterium]
MSKQPAPAGDGVLMVRVEIPKGSRNKYEYDPETGNFVFDRMLFSSVHYPSDYGFIPETLAEDGDPLDALVLVGEPTFPGCIIPAKPVAMLEMSDEKGRDQKVLCVPVHDPQWNWVTTIDDIPKNLRREITHFFEVYKNLEGKVTVVGDWTNREEAWRTIHESIARYAAANGS